MLKIDETHLNALEQQYPGLKKTILALEEDPLPPCAHCRSSNTAIVHVGAACAPLSGVIGRTIALAGATSKIKLIANGPKPGEYFCHSCERFFG